MTAARDDLAAQRPSLIYARQRPNGALGVWHDATSSKETASIANEGGGTMNPFSEYVLATPAALTASPEVAKLIHEAETRVMRIAAGLFPGGYTNNLTKVAEAATIRKGETP